MTEPQVILPAGWPRPKGYANGVSTRGRLVFVAGDRWDAQGVTRSGDRRQRAGTLSNVATVCARPARAPSTSFA
jgi:hypothetical protein